jgi:hypothetical protein
MERGYACRESEGGDIKMRHEDGNDDGTDLM